MRCSALTKKGHACPIDADRFNDGKPVCHVHDAAGIFQLQVAAKREESKIRREARSANRAKSRQARAADYAQQIEQLRAQNGLAQPAARKR